MNPTGTDLAVVQPWASRIQNHLQTGIKSFILAGHDLDAAVEDFKQQDGKHWKHAYSELLAEVKISQQTAHTLRTIARHPVLSDPSNYGSLPGSWSTLGELASLPSPELEQRMKAGEITPDLKRYQVREWKQSNHPPASGSSSDFFDQEPVFISNIGMQMPGNLSDLEADDIKESRRLFYEGWCQGLARFMQRDSWLLRTPEQFAFAQAVVQYFPEKLLAIALIGYLDSGRYVVGVVIDTIGQNQKSSGDSQGAAKTTSQTDKLKKCKTIVAQILSRDQ